MPVSFRAHLAFRVDHVEYVISSMSFLALGPAAFRSGNPGNVVRCFLFLCRQMLGWVHLCYALCRCAAGAHASHHCLLNDQSLHIGLAATVCWGKDPFNCSFSSWDTPVSKNLARQFGQRHLLRQFSWDFLKSHPQCKPVPVHAS